MICEWPSATIAEWITSLHTKLFQSFLMRKKKLVRSASPKNVQLAHAESLSLERIGHAEACER